MCFVVPIFCWKYPEAFAKLICIELVGSWKQYCDLMVHDFWYHPPLYSFWLSRRISNNVRCAVIIALEVWLIAVIIWRGVITQSQCLCCQNPLRRSNLQTQDTMVLLWYYEDILLECNNGEWLWTPAVGPVVPCILCICCQGNHCPIEQSPISANISEWWKVLCHVGGLGLAGITLWSCFPIKTLMHCREHQWAPILGIDNT